jgi:hypothetical protein
MLPANSPVLAGRSGARAPEAMRAKYTEVEVIRVGREEELSEKRE